MSEQEGIGRWYRGWDTLLVVVLGLALLGAGVLDVRSYLHHRGKFRPDFPFMESLTSERLGTSEVFLRNESLVVLDNMGQLEKNGETGFRHAMGPRSAILIWTQRSRAVLNIQLYNPVDDQDITVSYNDRVIEHFAHQPDSVIVRKYPLDLSPGRNEFAIKFARYNHAGVELTSTDSRPMAAMITQLDVTLN